MSLLLLLPGTETPAPTPTESAGTADGRGFILIRPKTVDDTVLASSNIAEVAPAVWDSATTYSAGDTAGIVNGYGFDIWRSLRDDNTNNDPIGLGYTEGWWAPDGQTWGEWDALIQYGVGANVIDAAAHRVYQSLTGITRQVTMTIASPCVCTVTAHGQAANTPVTFGGGTLPTGIVAGTTYYVLNPTANTFNISATPGGAAVNTSGSQSGKHTAVFNPNVGKVPASSPADWLDIGPTNKWAMFDSYNGTTTTHPYRIDVVLRLTGRADSLALLNLVNAVAARVIVSTALDGVVYDKSLPLLSTDGINDWYAYFFEDIEKKSTLLVTDLPAYADPTVEVVIEGNGASNVECGILSIGRSKDLGETLHDGAQIGITDYSRKDTDAFGNYTLVERPFSKRGSFRMVIPKGQVDSVHKVLAQYRATPAVYSASADYGSTMIFGFFRDFQIEIEYPLESLVSIEIEGLT